MEPPPTRTALGQMMRRFHAPGRTARVIAPGRIAVGDTVTPLLDH